MSSTQAARHRHPYRGSIGHHAVPGLGTTGGSAAVWASHQAHLGRYQGQVDDRCRQEQLPLSLAEGISLLLLGGSLVNAPHFISGLLGHLEQFRQLRFTDRGLSLSQRPFRQSHLPRLSIQNGRQ